MNLRERGIYRLPNGRTLIAKGNLLVAHSEGIEFLSYEVNDSGRLVHDGRLTAWDLSDVSDTGSTVSAEKNEYSTS